MRISDWSSYVCSSDLRIMVRLLELHLAGNVALGDHAIAHVGIVQPRAGQVGAAQGRATQIGAVEPGALHHRTTQIGTVEYGLAEIGVGEVDRLQIATGEVGAGQVRAGHGQVREVAELKDRPAPARPDRKSGGAGKRGSGRVASGGRRTNKKKNNT